MENGSGVTNSVYFRLLNIGPYGFRIQAGHFITNIINGNMSEGNVFPSNPKGWHMFGVTSEFLPFNNSRIINLYIDGLLLQSETFTSHTSIIYDTTYNRLNIGHRDTSPNFTVPGYINDFAYYNRLLTPLEVWQYFNNLSILNVDDTEFENNILLYPNPSSGIFNIETNTNDLLIITDILGKEILSKKCNSNKEIIDLSSQTNGIYFVKIISNMQQYTKRLIINK